MYFNATLVIKLIGTSLVRLILDSSAEYSAGQIKNN